MNRKAKIRMRNQISHRLILLFILGGLLSSCSMMNITHSIFKLDTTSGEKVDAIVESTFMELGYKGGHHVVNRKEEISYRLPGQPLFQFWVSYKISNEQLKIEMGHNTFYKSKSELHQIELELSRIAEIIIRKLKEENINASVEIESYKVPAMCILCSQEYNQQHRT